jgi:4-amino-4-deoxy-L-arabinose transferase-like glycosyltransferase
MVVLISPLPLNGDEAQYWQWSTTPDWGYFSKPPLIAWVIGSTAALLGDSAYGIRFALPFLHALAAWFLWLTARSLWPQEPGKAKWAAALYLLIPGVFSSSFLMTTDALLLPMAALVQFCFFQTLQNPKKLGWFVGLGLALGLGMLAKYAMLFLLFGMILVILIDRESRTTFISMKGLLVLVTAGTIILPNILWNQAHSFATLSHTASNMEGLASQTSYSLGPRLAELAKFWVGQFGLFGPLSLALLLPALVHGFRHQSDHHRFQLAILSLVPFLVISFQALSGGAHVNWAVIAYVPGTLLLTGFADDRLTKRLLLVGMALHLVVGTGFLALMAVPGQFSNTIFASPLKPFLGWSKVRFEVEQEWQGAKTPYTYLVTDTRLFHYSLAWQLRDRPDIPLRMWPRYAEPHSQRELIEPLPYSLEQPVLVAISRSRFLPRVLADFRETRYIRTVSIDLQNHKQRSFDLYVAKGYFPQTRDQEYDQKWQYLDAN